MSAATQRVKCTVSYDGTAYSGWQVQPGKVTVQSTVEKALATVLQDPVRIHASGRTDTGVHARGQVFHCDVSARRDLGRLAYSLNSVLPDAIRVTAAKKERPDFHARFDAVKKEYRYFIYNDAVLTPFERLYRHHLRYALDVDAMKAAAATLEGEHDFASFTVNPNQEIKSSVRHLYTLSVSRKGPEIMIRAVGNGFLYKMVRSLAGFLIEVGRGELDPAEAQGLLRQKKRTRRVPTAAAHGLFLWRVWY